ncbi:cytochrome d ubiquinol oxidase subunit II [Actinobaculum sp. 352]|uniref:cytochrome d ubiquinol oxidase subunit II n=1 Tax=Actinobaculum sp. 352 TaxID=2490946 RepID=UPI000F7EA7DB|nr:cytochrome d ubiquinol oxidase subunit II [Actinobaculum sp. 352]RTE50784.1 cytochrome d ubiquinol oxidase subunit II [Actinobaculum sp. 352]
MEPTTIQLLWFILIAVLWIGYFALEGFDFGVGMLLKLLPRNEKERRVALTSIGPHWDGNEVWLLTAGGATFAAFPAWYALLFSGMYIPLALILILLILRICSLEWRKTINTQRWRSTWDTLHTVAAWLVPFLWGVAFANFVQGMHIEVGTYESGTFIPVPADQLSAANYADAHHYLTGGFFSLLTPFTLLGGVVFVALFLSHGALFLALKTSGEMHTRALRLARRSVPASATLAVIWALIAQFSHTANSTASAAVLLLGIACIACAVFMTWRDIEMPAFLTHFVAIALLVVFIWTAIYPSVMKSSVDPAYSLHLVQASATAPTQTIMTIAALVFVPIVLGYTAWGYWVFRRRISVAQVPDEAAGLDPRNIRRFAASGSTAFPDDKQ